MSTYNVLIENHGSICLFRPQNVESREWLEDNTGGETQWFGGALVVEPRYVDDLVDGLIDAGFTVA